MKTKALIIHDSLYQKLSDIEHNSHVNKYQKILQDLLKIENIQETIFSTAEHIAPFNVRSSVSFLLPQLLLQHFGLVEKRDIVILGGSLVALDNFDYPRGFYLNSDKKQAFNLFTQKEKKSAALLNGALTYQEIKDDKKKHFFNNYGFLKEHFYKTYPSYAHQLADIMSSMVKQWKFDSTNVKFYPLEEIAKNILIKLLNSNDESIDILLKNIHKFLNLTYNVFCSWSDTRGTALFWEVDKNRLNRVKFLNGTFIGKNIKFAPTSDTILQLLKEQKILPAVTLSLFVISWLPNIPVAGGQRQYWYWRYMIEAFDEIFGFSKKQTRLSNFGYNRLDFSQLEILSKFGTGIDLILKDIDKQILFDNVFNLPVNSSSKMDGYYGS